MTLKRHLEHGRELRLGTWCMDSLNAGPPSKSAILNEHNSALGQVSIPRGRASIA